MSHAARGPADVPPVVARARAVADRVHGGPASATTGPAYVGLVTRAIGFSVDAALINLTAVVVGVAVGLAVSVLELPDGVEEALYGVGGLAYFVWSVGYFVVFWSTTGQTPGNNLLHIRVCDRRGGQLPPARAVLRLVALTLAAIPLFAGFLPILVDNRRRGVHDMLAGSVVVETQEDPAVRRT